MHSVFFFILVAFFPLIAHGMEWEKDCLLFGGDSRLIEQIELGDTVRKKRDLDAASGEKEQEQENKKQKRKLIVRLKVPSYYLVMADTERPRQVTTLRGKTRHQVAANYIKFIFSDSKASPYKKVWRKLRDDFPYQLLRQDDEGRFYLTCTEKQCTYGRRHTSVEGLIMHMHMHHVLTHRKESEFYRGILNRIGNSFKQAYALWKSAPLW